MFSFSIRDSFDLLISAGIFPPESYCIGAQQLTLLHNCNIVQAKRDGAQAPSRG
jgi:hypothetical protein